jgi:hypothetical protein
MIVATKFRLVFWATIMPEARSRVPFWIWPTSPEDLDEKTR